MAGSNRRAKDAAMAAMLKEQGVERTSSRCPICHAIVSLRQFYNHIVTACNGGRD